VADSVRGNVSFANAGFGMEWTGAYVPVLACNDWFGNGAGAVSGLSPGASDLAVDPLFCDAAHSDVTLRADSPLADAPGCGLIGALGIGCPGSPTATLVSRFEAVEVEGAVEVRWQLSREAAGARVSVERAPAETGPWTLLEGAQVTREGLGVVRDAETAAGGDRWYRLVLVVPDGRTVTEGPISASPEALPKRLGLAVTGANPTGGQAELMLAIPREVHARVRVFDVQGREVATLADRVFRAGRHRLTWNAAATSPGVYFVRVQVAGENRTSRIVVSD
jgi:hypothetical protein